MSCKIPQILIGSTLLLIIVRSLNKGNNNIGQYPEDVVANYALSKLVPGFGIINLSANLINSIYNRYKNGFKQGIPTLPVTEKGEIYGLR